MLLLKEVGPAGEGRASVMEQLLDEVSATTARLSQDLSLVFRLCLFQMEVLFCIMIITVPFNSKLSGSGLNG